MRRKPKTSQPDSMKYPRHRDLYSPILMDNNYDQTNGCKEFYGKNRDVIGQRCPDQQQQLSLVRLSTCSNFSIEHVTKRGSQDCATVPQKEMNFNRYSEYRAAFIILNLWQAICSQREGAEFQIMMFWWKLYIPGPSSQSMSVLKHCIPNVYRRLSTVSVYP